MADSDDATKPYVTRFAPSPSGLLHKGHAYSAHMAYSAAQENGGRFLLRIEDIDTGRCKPEYTEAIYEDLAWLGLKWEQPVRFQSQHLADYRQAFNTLRGMELIYPCFCTRKDIRDEIGRAKRAPHGYEGPVYPGICRGLTKAERTARIEGGTAHAWRLDLSKALQQIKGPLVWHDKVQGAVTAKPEGLGDTVLARKDIATSYHLSVVVDDALQGITHIVRGEDLFHTTHIHIVLQRLLGLPTPQYHHHGLLLDKDGERYAKRNKSATLRELRENGAEPSELLNTE